MCNIYSEYFKYDCPHCNSQFVFTNKELEHRKYGLMYNDF